MNRYFLTFLVTILLLHPMTVHADAKGECRNRVNNELAGEQRYYRAILFGKKKAEFATIGEMRYDNESIAWIKEDENKWINADPDQSGLEWSDDLMDTNDEYANRMGGTEDGGTNPDYLYGQRGIFETKRVLTSELIPYLLQSIRALECNINIVCEQVRLSERKKSDEESPIDIPEIRAQGCKQVEGKQTFPECHFGQGEAKGTQSDSKTYCDEIGNQLIQREQKMLKLVVEYDAGYRTLLQFAGGFDMLVGGLQWSLTGTIRQTAGLIGKLNRLPCFISSCDSFPEDLP